MIEYSFGIERSKHDITERIIYYLRCNILIKTVLEKNNIQYVKLEIM